MAASLNPQIRTTLQRGVAIPACPLALTAERVLDERRQRAVLRYYNAAGAGGVAVGVHTTQFAIRDPKIGLFEPILKLAAEEMDRADGQRREPLIRVAGICGRTPQAVAEAALARRLGYHAGLLSLAAMKDAGDDELLVHCRVVAEVIPVVGFYLQAAVGGRVLPYSFWRRFAEIENVVAIKMAPFNRYHTVDVMRAVAEAGRDDIALYTGNDDSIIVDLLTPFTFEHQGRRVTRRIVGGLLGHWGVWTRCAVQLLDEIKAARTAPTLDARWLERAIAVTDMNAALFDSANGFRGCIPGILEVLRRGGLVPSIHCLNPHEVLSPGQAEELTRVARAYPELTDDAFVAANRDRWLG